jgi:phosphoglycolate phosphatase-like HAD superfamily hydrolase
MIHAAGVAVEYANVVDYFQSIFHGNGTDGLILRERWIARANVLERLNQMFRFAVFTGRLRWEAELTLRRFAPDLPFEPIVGVDDVTNPKPAPDGLLHIARLAPSAGLWYVGDTVDDARSAKAAGVPFIGIASPSSERREQLVALLNAQGAKAVLEDINQLEEALTA